MRSGLDAASAAGPCLETATVLWAPAKHPPQPGSPPPVCTPRGSSHTIARLSLLAATGSCLWVPSFVDLDPKERPVPAVVLPPSRLVAFTLLMTLWLSAAALAGDGDPSAARRWFGGPERPTDLGPTALSDSMRAAACANCHREIAEQWRGSQHANAWTDALFQRAYRREPEAACRHCHAPLAGSAVEPQGRAAADGIDCATCHVRGDDIYGVPKPDATGALPHPVMKTRDLRQAGYCAGCHQFGFLGFPEQKGRGLFETEHLQQATLQEWQASAAAAKGLQCQACHMPKFADARGKLLANHAFAATTPQALRAAITVEVGLHRQPQNLGWAVQVGSKMVGHQLPTGDVFRRLQWCLRSPTGKFVAALLYGRTWQPYRSTDADHGPYLSRRLAKDTRVAGDGLPPPVRTVNTPVSSGRWQWQLDYVRSETPAPPAGPLCADGSRTPVATGSIDVIP